MTVVSTPALCLIPISVFNKYSVASFLTEDGPEKDVAGELTLTQLR